MKSNRGITLTSLIIYVIGITIMITLVVTITGYFDQNINEVTIQNLAQEQHTRFVSYLTKDINSENITYVKTANSNNNYIIIYFDDGKEHQYVYNEGTIFFINIEDDAVTKKIALCTDVTVNSESVFEFDANKISYNFKINSEEFSGSYNVNIK